MSIYTVTFRAEERVEVTAPDHETAVRHAWGALGELQRQDVGPDWQAVGVELTLIRRGASDVH